MQALWESTGKIALDAGLDQQKRLAAVAVMAAAPWSEQIKLKSLLDARQSLKLQLAIVETFSTSDAEEAPDVLLAGFQGLSPKVQESIIDAHFARQERLPKLLNAIERQVVSPASISALRRAQLLESSDKAPS